MKIWWRGPNGVECVDTCSKKDAAYLVGQYTLAYGHGAKVWAGLKRDEPQTPMNVDHLRYRSP
jgi:hypothetical protein